ncbi:PfkB family carbohydrate kinase [Fusobacterium sp.]|uniref:PfkB family carbohydrate kinase n=1 Tax=Fusobacterium sp. TaxID=68766 RepID=UPI002901564D|nr:PfkB family carbohydrate kinase [Fusobacterium sp.]MDU1910376.1 PfkB family carbohydrate kinase [Fusobacterium sp.]
MYDITALGELLIDFTSCGVSEAGMKTFEQNPGGAPANVLAAAQNFGMKTAFIGKIGADIHGDFLRKVLENKGIETKGLISDSKFFTTLAFVSLENGERKFSFARKPGADTKLEISELNLELIRNSRIFHFGSLSLIDEPVRSATISAVKEAKKAGAVISYDPNYRALLWETKEEAMKEMRSVIKYVDIIKISDEETYLLTDCCDPSEAAAHLINQGISCVVVTLGADGALLKTKDFEVREKGRFRQAVDTTGAGDSFWGGILFKFIKCQKKIDDISKEEARNFLKFANETAGMCVEKRGAIPAMPLLEEVLKNL